MWAGQHPRIGILVLSAGVTACGSPVPGSPGGVGQETATDSSEPDVPDSGTAESAHYCRSLDPRWADAYIDETDQILRDLIVEHDLLGDPTLYVEGGECRRRPLPAITQPLPLLGRALFFSPTLSGDGDVTCATCHHPLLGGADAISLPMGPGADIAAVGADRVARLSDPDTILLARNSPSVFNVALWDRALFWDGRIEALTPEAGFGGAVGEILSPIDLPGVGDLVEAQSYLPVLEHREMAGRWGQGFAEDEALWEALAARLRSDPGWVARFEEACAGGAAAPVRWRSHCASAGTPEALITYPAIAMALSAYQRSLVFVDTPWSAYVQGDVGAISDAAKTGAIIFLSTIDDGGENCQACHKGDFFTDESFHAIGTPQIGPGDPLGTGVRGLDQGRAEVTGAEADRYAFRTPTLLNLSVTAPYFHAGPVPGLTRVIQHYRGLEESMADYFGYPDQPRTQPPAWCRMTQFRDIEGCEDLYGVASTLGGDLDTSLEDKFTQIAVFDGTFSAVYLDAFLRTLTDPQVTDPEALSPWIEPDAVLTVTDTSAEWDEWCDTMVMRPPDNDLRVKGIRWLALGGFLPGNHVNTGASLVDLFGAEYWGVFETGYQVDTGLSRAAPSVAAGVLALLSAEQRSLLLDAHQQHPIQQDTQAIVRVRQEVSDAMSRLRAEGGPVSAAGLEAPLLESARLEAAAVLSVAESFRQVQTAWSDADLSAHHQTLRAYLSGDLSVLPEGVYVDGARSLILLPELASELAARGMMLDAALASRILSYATFTATPPCRLAFIPRQEISERRAGYYGFSPWVTDVFFDLHSGNPDPLVVQLELGGLIAALEAEAGVTSLEQTLQVTVAASREYDAARAEAAAALRVFAEPGRSASEAAVLAVDVERAFTAIAQAEHHLLAAELEYYLDLWAALDSDKRQEIIDYIGCLESPEVQAMRDRGGFDVLGGGSCLP